MLKSLIKSTVELRVETEEEADQLNQELQREALDNGYTLTNFSKSRKDVKSKGEVVDSWYIIKYTYQFNDAKAPETFLKNINYVMFTGGTSEEEAMWE